MTKGKDASGRRISIDKINIRFNGPNFKKSSCIWRGKDDV